VARRDNFTSDGQQRDEPEHQDGDAGTPPVAGGKLVAEMREQKARR
jgi:hypothetical protein